MASSDDDPAAGTEDTAHPEGADGDPNGSGGPADGRASLHRGARVGLVLALLVVVLAGYRLTVPVDLRTASGTLIRCGSGLHPPSGRFLVNTCGSLVERNRTEAVFELIAAVVLAAGALWAFAGRRTTRARPDRPVV